MQKTIQSHEICFCPLLVLFCFFVLYFYVWSKRFKYQTIMKVNTKCSFQRMISLKEKPIMITAFCYFTEEKFGPLKGQSPACQSELWLGQSKISILLFVCCCFFAFFCSFFLNSNCGLKWLCNIFKTDRVWWVSHLFLNFIRSG